MGDTVIHSTGITGAESPDELGALFGANLAGVGKSNAAARAMSAGDFEAAAAVSLNGLGEALLRAGRLAEADEVLRKALAVREREGPDVDAAATRDNIGALREAQGRFEEAREVRLRGQAGKKMMCGNYDCPVNQMMGLDRLSACSACKAVFYCSKSCQAQDWKNRHKPLCKARTASAQSTGN